jgi:hypothetical protein
MENRPPDVVPPANGAPADEEISEGAAARALEQARARRVRDCLAEVNAALARHDCRLVAVQQWVDGQPQPLQVQVWAGGR